MQPKVHSTAKTKPRSGIGEKKGNQTGKMGNRGKGRRFIGGKGGSTGGVGLGEEKTKNLMGKTTDLSSSWSVSKVCLSWVVSVVTVGTSSSTTRPSWTNQSINQSFKLSLT